MEGGKIINWSPKTWARVTGFIGLLVLLCGSYSHSVNTELIQIEDASRTIENLRASETIFRLGFVCGLLMETIFVLYAFLLFILFKPVHQNAAVLMLILALVPAPVFFLNQLNHFAAFLLAGENSAELMLFYLNLHKQGGFIISIFFGLWLFPLGYLVYRSGYVPRVLGVLLMVGCFGYLINFVQGFLFPGTESTLWTNPALVVTHLAEIAFMLWLLIMGVDQDKYGAKRK